MELSGEEDAGEFGDLPPEMAAADISLAREFLPSIFLLDVVVRGCVLRFSFCLGVVWGVLFGLYPCTARILDALDTAAVLFHSVAYITCGSPFQEVSSTKSYSRSCSCCCERMFI